MSWLSRLREKQTRLLTCGDCMRDFGKPHECEAPRHCDCDDFNCNSTFGSKKEITK